MPSLPNIKVIPKQWVIRCIETGWVYASQGEACRYLGIASSALSKHLNNPMEYKDAEGFHFERIVEAIPNRSKNT